MSTHRLFPWAGYLSAAAVLLTTGCDRSGNEFAAPPPPNVTVQAPAVRNVTHYAVFNGTTAATETVDVRARVEGILTEMQYRAGERVEAGTPLFQIDPAEYTAIVNQAKGEVAIQAAKLKLEETTLESTRSVHERGAVTDIELAQALAKRDQSKAGLQAAEAALARAELDLEWTAVVAPVSGRVGRELVSVGNLVGAGERTLLTRIVQDQEIYAYFAVNERQLLPYLEERPRPGEERSATERVPVELELSDGRVYEMAGEINYADIEVDRTTGTLEVRALFPNPEEKLFPGLFVRIRVPEAESEALLVPEVAVQRDMQGSYVLAVGADNMVVRHDVTVGVRDGRDRVITAGLDASARVIVAGLQRARPGVAVNPKEAAGSPAAPPADAAPESSSTDPESTDS